MEIVSEYIKRFVTTQMIKYLELQGCECVENSDIAKAFQYWKQAFIFREIYSIPRDADQRQNIGIYAPFKSVEELTERRFQLKHMMLEQLNTYIRWLSPSYTLTIKRAISISEQYYKDDYLTNELLMDMFRMNWEHPNPLNKDVHLLLKGIIDVRSHKRRGPFNYETVSKEISMYMDYIQEKVWPYLEKIKIIERKQDFDKYEDVAHYLLKFTQVFLEAGPSSELANTLLVKLTRLVREEKRRNLPTTLLHQAVNAVYLFGVKLLVQCGADINAPDHRNNLPIHQINAWREKYDETKNIASFLIRNGSEVDAVNKDGRSVHSFLQQIKILKNNLEKVTLQCLAARAIPENKIRVHKDEYPEHVIDIVKRHGGRIV